MNSRDPIRDYVAALRTEVGSHSLRRRLVGEVEAHLREAVAARIGAGVAPDTAVSETISLFGEPQEVAVALKREVPARRWPAAAIAATGAAAAAAAILAMGSAPRPGPISPESGWFGRPDRESARVAGALSLSPQATEVLATAQRLGRRASACLLQHGGRADSAGGDAQEEAVIVLADQLGAGPTRARAADVDSVEALGECLGARMATAGLPVSEIKWGPLTKATRDRLTELLADKRVSRLASIATIRIGVVTGANEVFVRAPEEIPDLVGVRGFPVVSRSAWLTTPAFREADLAARDSVGDRTRLLVIERAWRRRGRLAEELTGWEAESVDERSHCRRRERWYCLSDIRPPDAFLPYMGASPRGLVLNASGATCTNAIHRVDFADGIDGAVVAASTWTSLFEVCAEIFGRHYGGGVLKLEPTAAGAVPNRRTRPRARRCRGAKASNA